MPTEHVILGTQFRNLKTKPIVLEFSNRTGHVQLLRALATKLDIKPHRSASETQERVTKEIHLRPRDIHIEGAHHLSPIALEVLRDIWDETDSEGPRRTVRIVLAGDDGFIQKIAKRHPQLADRAGIYPHG